MNRGVFHFLRPKMNVLVIAIVFIVFIVIDQLAIPKIIGAQIVPSADYRSALNFAQLKAIVELVNNDKTPKVIMVGDSITYGGGVANGNETSAHYLQKNILKNGKYYHVYNLGLQGAAPGDMYLILQALKLTKKDVVMYDMNIGEYGAKPVSFPTITPKLVNESSTVSGILKTDSTNPIEEYLRVFVTDHWKLFAYRSMVKTYLEDKLSGKNVTVQTVHKPDPKPWYTIDWTARTKHVFKRGDNIFKDNDPSLEMLKLMIHYVKSQNATMFVYNIALNQQMMAQYNMIDRPKYDANIRRLKNAVVTAGAVYVDYQKLIPSRDFVDSLHPTNEGNIILANQMSKDINPYLAKGSTS